MKESATASHVRLDAAQQNVLLWRNNTGAFKDETGRVVRYGLCNESAQLSKNVKSSDYIGITPVLITPEMVGRVIGVFTAVETKPSGWKLLPSDERGLAQKNFHDIVKNAGGFAGFASTVQQFRNIIGR